jgi:hypothetical protein
MTPTEAVEHLIAKGWGKTSAAALVAVMVSDDGAIPIRSDRWSRLLDWASGHDCRDPDAAETKLDFVAGVELRHG